VHRPRRTHSQTSPTNNYHFPERAKNKNKNKFYVKIVKLKTNKMTQKYKEKKSHQTYVCSLLQSLIKFVNSIVGLAEVGMPSAHIESAGNVKPLIVYKMTRIIRKENLIDFSPWVESVDGLWTAHHMSRAAHAWMTLSMERRA
jgi:hypothetical protein